MPLAALPLLLLFAFTLFTSATLLFLVQPMVGKLLLPMLGGTPAVWNTCMVFFQALLLAGYGYAHITTTWLGARRQALLHVGILLLPFLTLGFTIDRGLLDYGEGSPIPGLLLVLLISVGLPFFVVSTSAPLLQKWFAATGHPAAQDPYFLYGASNLGSMLALFGYPAVVEPLLTLDQQRMLWRIGYGFLVLLTALCAFCVWRSRHVSEESPRHANGNSWVSESVSASRRLRWIALAFVPSSLMLGVTTYMTTDVAAIPLLWVLPLGLYLLSFILVFSRLPEGVHRTMVAILPYLILPLLFLMLSELPWRIGGRITLHLAVLFMVAMVCHGELARDRPSPRYLTEFYLWMSFGGVLGGLFNALVAPLAFNGIVEYPLALVFACLLMPPADEDPESGPPYFDVLFMGILLGAGMALLIPALGRTHLVLRNLAADRVWIGLAGVAALLIVWRAAAGKRQAKAAYWLDLGLPVALGILLLGLELGLRMSVMHRGIDRMFAAFAQAISGWAPSYIVEFFGTRSTGPLLLFVWVVPVVICALFISRPLRFGLGVGALFLAASVCELLDDDLQARDRSFFGALRVADSGPYRRLYHGTTLHGQQRLHWDDDVLLAGDMAMLGATDPLGGLVLLAARQDVLTHPGREALTYFHRTGPIGQIFTAYQHDLADKAVGLIGLGSGTLASYGQPGQRVTYYEIDPLIKRIAYNKDHFTFVQDALDRGVRLDLVLGDARLKLEERARQASQEKFALLVVDAFSSDSIPVHLITRQAFEQAYLPNLAESGILAFHISNRYLNLEPVLANLAEALDLVGYVQADNESGIPGKASSHWVVLSRKEYPPNRLVHHDRWEQWQEERNWDQQERLLVLLTLLPDQGGLVHAQSSIGVSLFEQLQAPWHKLKTRADVGIWSDDYSNLLRVFDWKH